MMNAGICRKRPLREHVHQHLLRESSATVVRNFSRGEADMSAQATHDDNVANPWPGAPSPAPIHRHIAAPRLRANRDHGPALPHRGMLEFDKNGNPSHERTPAAEESLRKKSFPRRVAFLHYVCVGESANHACGRRTTLNAWDGTYARGRRNGVGAYEGEFSSESLGSIPGVFSCALPISLRRPLVSRCR